MGSQQRFPRAAPNAVIFTKRRPGYLVAPTLVHRRCSAPSVPPVDARSSWTEAHLFGGTLELQGVPDLASLVHVGERGERLPAASLSTLDLRLRRLVRSTGHGSMKFYTRSNKQRARQTSSWNYRARPQPALDHKHCGTGKTCSGATTSTVHPHKNVCRRAQQRRARCSAPGTEPRRCGGESHRTEIQ